MPEENLILAPDHMNYKNSFLNYSDEGGEYAMAVAYLTAWQGPVLEEDDPYGDLKFDGNPYGYISKIDPSGSILLGTFSKTVTPGMRLGYMVIKNEELRIRINTAKEAADLHSNIFSQYILFDYLTHHDLEAHITKIRKLYKESKSVLG